MPSSRLSSLADTSKAMLPQRDRKLGKKGLSGSIRSRARPSLIDRSRWSNAHKVPEDQIDSAAWVKWEQEYKDVLKTWIREFPDDFYLQNYAWANAIEYDDGLSEEEVLYVFEADLKAAERTWMADAW